MPLYRNIGSVCPNYVLLIYHHTNSCQFCLGPNIIKCRCGTVWNWHKDGFPLLFFPYFSWPLTLRIYIYDRSVLDFLCSFLPMSKWSIFNHDIRWCAHACSRYKSAAVVDSDSDLPPVEELITPSWGRKRCCSSFTCDTYAHVNFRAPRNSESPPNASPSSKPVAKKTHIQDDATPIKVTACSLTKSPVKGVTRGGTAAEDIVKGKRV